MKLFRMALHNWRRQMLLTPGNTVAIKPGSISMQNTTLKMVAVFYAIAGTMAIMKPGILQRLTEVFLQACLLTALPGTEKLINGDWHMLAMAFQNHTVTI